jgi:photosystem II stability/assembly factor-like uncharacterized protein
MLSLAAAILSASGVARAQTPSFKHLQGGRIGGVYFVDSTHGWSAEDGARIRFSEDGGQTWDYQDTPNTIRDELGDIFFIDQDIGWAATIQGEVLRTLDGGDTWDKINQNPSVITDAQGDNAKINTIFMFDAFDGWIGGDDGTLYTTSNGGVNWIPYPNPPEGFTVDGAPAGDPEDAYKIRFFDADSGFMVADWGHAYRYEQGTWEPLELNNELCSWSPGNDHPNLELWD